MSNINFEISTDNLPGYMTWDEAVKHCDNMEDRWRLPTMEELDIMYNQSDVDFGNYGLWSCEEKDDMAWSMGFHTGNIYLNLKTNINYVRPVRNLIVGKEYWGSDIPHPLSPSDEDVETFKSYMIEGRTLLLGCTKKLIPITTIQMDIDPWYEAETVIKQDWLTNTEHYDNIIGDGLFAFSQELAEGVIKMASKYSKRLVIRAFNRKLPIMKMGIAKNFPKAKEFTIKPTEVRMLKDYNFFIWDFQGT